MLFLYPIRLFAEAACVFLLGTILAILMFGFFPLGIIVIVAAMAVRETLYTSADATVPLITRAVVQRTQSMSRSGRYQPVATRLHGGVSPHRFLADGLSTVR